MKGDYALRGTLSRPAPVITLESMADMNPYRSPLAPSQARGGLPAAGSSLAIGLVIDGAGALLGAAWLSRMPALRFFLPFAATHAVAAALIAYRTRSGERELSAGDHFFLRYGAVMMASATAAVRLFV